MAPIILFQYFFDHVVYSKLMIPVFFVVILSNSIKVIVYLKLTSSNEYTESIMGLILPSRYKLNNLPNMSKM